MRMVPANNDGKHVGVPDLEDEKGISDAHSGLGDLGLWQEDCRRIYLLL